jgi:hypothetical protein
MRCAAATKKFKETGGCSWPGQAGTYPDRTRQYEQALYIALRARFLVSASQAPTSRYFEDVNARVCINKGSKGELRHVLT